MGVTNSNKQISTQYIECDGTFEVLLALTAAPDIVSHPTDIVLILDRSGSMAGSPLAKSRTGFHPVGPTLRHWRRTGNLQ